jgi:hypothetical protein
MKADVFLFSGDGRGKAKRSCASIVLGSVYVLSLYIPKEAEAMPALTPVDNKNIVTDGVMCWCYKQQLSLRNVDDSSVSQPSAVGGISVLDVTRLSCILVAISSSGACTPRS